MKPVLPSIAKTTSANPNEAPCSPCGGSSPALLARLSSCILCVLSWAALSKCGAWGLWNGSCPCPMPPALLMPLVPAVGPADPVAPEPPMPVLSSCAARLFSPCAPYPPLS